MLRRRLLSATALVATVASTALALPTAAPAEQYRETEYRADIEVKGEWNFHRKEAYGDRQVDEVTASANFSAKASIEYVLFRNGALVTPERWAPSTVTTTGSAIRKETRPKPGDTHVLDTITSNCDAGAVGAMPAQLRKGTNTAGHVGLVMRLTASIGMNAGDCAERVGGSPMADDPYSPIGGDTFDKSIQLPSEVIGFGEITEFLQAGSTQKSPAVCPGKDAFTDECTFTWTATVKFVRTGGDLYDPAQQPPPPPPSDVNTGMDPRAEAISAAVAQYARDNPTPVDPRAEAVSHAVEEYGKHMYDDPRAQIISDAVAQYSRYVELELGCTNGCSGTGEITPAGGGAKPRAAGGAVAFAAGKAKPIARVKFTVPAGKPRKIRIRIPAKARAALKRVSRATMKVTLKAKKGGPTSTRTLVLRRARG
ncbi:MAG TPA: hypothetical protein VF549_05590 [Solirubrobacteraceae bacterium]|jgi:hypothetical protein